MGDAPSRQLKGNRLTNPVLEESDTQSLVSSYRLMGQTCRAIKSVSIGCLGPITTNSMTMKEKDMAKRQSTAEQLLDAVEDYELEHVSELVCDILQVFSIDDERVEEGRRVFVFDDHSAAVLAPAEGLQVAEVEYVVELEVEVDEDDDEEEDDDDEEEEDDEGDEEDEEEEQMVVLRLR